ncbi:MAG: PAQR family membrane homeostasis protein TrhA [Methanobacteriota archaeon]
MDRSDERFNTWSHLFGAVLAGVGLVSLVLRAEGALAVAGVAIYGGSMVLLFSASTLHHVVSPERRAAGLTRKLDHIAIHLLIAGTYTPVCLSIGGGWGWSILAAIWAFAGVGIVLEIAFRRLPRWASTGIYVGMGWTGFVAIRPLVQAFPVEGLLLLLGGGLAYTLGAVIYGTKRPDPLPGRFGHHEIFHVLVLVGGALQYAFMANYVVPRF